MQPPQMIQHTAIGFAFILVMGTAAQAAVTISSDPTKNMKCAHGVCSPTARDAVLNAVDLANMLASSDVKIKTGNGALDIAVVSSFSWTSGSRLTLDAQINVAFVAPVDVAGIGSVTILTNDGGTGGDLAFAGGGQLGFRDMSSSLNLNGGNYMLVNDIATLAHAIALNPSGLFALANHYNASVDGTYSNSPIASFSGTFEGLGNTISNLTLADIKSKKGVVNNIGLFATSSGTIRDINLVNAKVTAGGRFDIWAGTLVGYNKGTVLQASATGEMGEVHPATVGGLVGGNEGQIVRCNAATNITDVLTMGGLVGQNRASGLIAQSHADGILNGSLQYANEVGGLVGINWDTTSTITLSYSTATVQGSEFVGGLVGVNHGIVSLSFSQGAVLGSHDQVGGLIGINGGPVANSYSVGPVTGGHQTVVGGLIGETFDSSNVSQAYAAGPITVDDPIFLGGVAGHDHSGTGVFTNTYWDMTSTGVADPSEGVGGTPNDPGVTGLTNKQFKYALPAGFDHSVWGRKKVINGGLPYLRDNPPP